MRPHPAPATRQHSRRDFIKVIAATGAYLYIGPGRLLSQQPAPGGATAPALTYQYRTFSAQHIEEVRDWLAELERNGTLSQNKTYQSYIGGFEYHPPKELPRARSIIVLSRPQRVRSLTFRLNGRSHEMLVPTGYVGDGIERKDIQEHLRKNVLKNPAAKLEPVALPLKTLAVRTGLAEYGKNNITYVKDYGSFHALGGYYTDLELPDQWGPLRLMRLCTGCSICVKACPTKIIKDEMAVIDVGRCLPLYNELPDPIPAWMDPGIHHTLVGCLKCQWTCPANQDATHNVWKMADFTEEETRFIMGKGDDKKLQSAVCAKVKDFIPDTEFAYFRRNAQLALVNVTKA